MCETHFTPFFLLLLLQVAVTALEVALELWLALTVSPVAKLMRGSATPASALLQEELRDQAAAVWRFIMDRQLEAPDEFAALQVGTRMLSGLVVCSRSTVMEKQVSVWCFPCMRVSCI